MSARKTALDALIACRKEGAWSNSILKQYIARDRLDRRDAALAARLCYGVLQNRYFLDHYLRQLLTGKLSDLHPAVRDILHLGLYQIYLMDKIPESAAVNESVTLTRQYCKNLRYAPGLVNGVLRSAVRTKGTLEEPVTLEDRYSHPKALIDMLKANVGEELLEPMLKANNAAPQTTLQVNTLRITPAALALRLLEQQIETEPHPWLPDCLSVTSTGDLEKLDAFRDGLFYVQDAAAKLSVLCAELQPGWNVLDCCAAPGGKSFAAAIAMQGQGHIVSCDVHDHKIPLIAAGAKRLGLDIIRPMRYDATAFNPEWEDAMDAVIADVPCSGLGIIRKKPDIRYKDLDSMKELPKLQMQILENQARYVKKGGTLLYSTCTLRRQENEKIVGLFIEKNPEFELVALKLHALFPRNLSGMFTLVPGQYDTDGFFIAKMRRKV